MSEQVLMVWVYHDGPRTGVAHFQGELHYFDCLFDETVDEFSDDFELCPVSPEFVEVAQKQWKIFRDWKYKFRSGLVSTETHPGRGGFDKEYDELEAWLKVAILELKPLKDRYTAKFQALPPQGDALKGVMRDFAVT